MGRRSPPSPGVVNRASTLPNSSRHDSQPALPQRHLHRLGDSPLVERRRRARRLAAPVSPAPSRPPAAGRDCPSRPLRRIRVAQFSSSSSQQNIVHQPLRPVPQVVLDVRPATRAIVVAEPQPRPAAIAALDLIKAVHNLLNLIFSSHTECYPSQKSNVVLRLRPLPANTPARDRRIMILRPFSVTIPLAYLVVPSTVWERVRGERATPRPWQSSDFHVCYDGRQGANL